MYPTEYRFSAFTCCSKLRINLSDLPLCFVSLCEAMWLKGRGMRKDDFLKRFCSACLKLCIFNLLILIFLSCSANKIEVIFFPSHPLKYFLCSFGSYALEVQLSAWRCNSLSCMTRQSEFKLTFQFWSFFTFGVQPLHNIFGDHH